MSKIINKNYSKRIKNRLEIGDYWGYDRTPFYNAKQVSISKTKDGKIIVDVVKWEEET